MTDIFKNKSIDAQVFPILTWPDPVLNKYCEDIDPLTLEKTHGMNIQQLLRDMIHTCLDHDGVGLAAPQIGLLINVVVVVINDKVITLINPKILYKSNKTNVFNEGCLSIPGYFVDIERPTELSVGHIDASGVTIHTKYTGIYARVIQHELDHLEGKTLCDSLNNEDKEHVISLIQSNI